MEPMKHPVVVVAGGLSHQRAVSLRSGRTVAAALRRVGHDVIEADIDAHLVPLLRSRPDAVVFPMLHGGVGEDGGLSEVLRLLSIPFVGSGPASCRISYDKPVATRIVASAGVTSPRQVALTHDILRELGAATVVDAVAEAIGLPLVVKPARGGSSLGVCRVSDVADLPQAMADAYAYDERIVVEQYVSGTEVAIGMITTASGTRVLPVVEIRPTGGVYDYSAMYTAGETRLTAPADIPDDQVRACEQMALTVREVLDLDGISRVDAVIDDHGRPVFLEAGVAPGMTDTSLVPVGLEAAGLDLGEVCSELVADAHARLHD